MARPKRIIICPGCGEEKEHQGKGLCKPCYVRHYWEANREKVLAYQRLWARQHPRDRRAYMLVYNAEHRDDQCCWREENPKKCAVSSRRWRQANPDYQHDWNQANPGKVVATRARRRARRRALPDTLIPEQAEHLLMIGQAMYPGEELQLDHIVPLSKGGGTTLANMHAIPAKLNMLKHDKLPEEIYKQIVLL